VGRQTRAPIGSHQALFPAALFLAALVLVLPSSALASSGKPRLSLALKGIAPELAESCGAQRWIRETEVGQPVTATVRVRDSHQRMRRLRALTLLEVSRCEGRSWVRVSHKRLGRKRGRYTQPVETSQAGNYRVRVQLRRKRRNMKYSRPRYLRVAGDDAAAVIDVPVSFEVRNVNRSATTCRPGVDGLAYRIQGRLVGPREALIATEGPRAVTLYLHELAHGQWFWRFTPVPPYDYVAAQARAGHTSIVIDRLGYGLSPRPPGTQTCLGAQADMAHQIVDQLRSGVYASQELMPVAFERVAIAGHGLGGAVAESATYSFGNVDALVLLGWASGGFTSQAIQTKTAQDIACATGGEPSEPGGSPGYAYFHSSAESYRETDFHDVDPAVFGLANGMRARDPCGDNASIDLIITSSAMHSDEITVPVLLVHGMEDATYDQPEAGEQQGELYGASEDVTTIFIEDASHALTLERKATEMREQVAAWLAQHGL